MHMFVYVCVKEVANLVLRNNPQQESNLLPLTIVTALPLSYMGLQLHILQLLDYWWFVIYYNITYFCIFWYTMYIYIFIKHVNYILYPQLELNQYLWSWPPLYRWAIWVSIDTYLCSYSEYHVILYTIWIL